MSEWDKFAVAQPAPPSGDDWSKFPAATNKPDRKVLRAALEAQMKREQEERDADLKEAGGYWANLGAGMNNVVQGGRQLLGKIPGVKDIIGGETDDEIRARRLLDEKLADSRVGGGLTQLAGEILASAPLTGGAAGAVGKGVSLIPGVSRAAQVGGRIANLGLVGRGAVEGAAGAALSSTTEDESRGTQAAIGGALGALSPLAMAGANKLYRTLSKSHAGNRAAAVFEKQLGKQAIDEITDAASGPGPGMSILPLSTAAVADNPALAALERGARTRGDWGAQHDRVVAERAWEAVQRATGAADDLGARVADRETAMQASKSFMDAQTHPTDLRRATNDVTDLVDALRSTPIARQNPEVTNLVGQTEAMLSHPDRTAADFSSQYWRLSEMLDSPNTSPEAAEIIRRLRDGVAEAADTASGDKHFSDMLGIYKAEQGRVGEAEAAKAIRESFMSAQGVPKTTREWYGTPEITAQQLRKTIANQGEDAYGSTLDTGARQGLEDLTKELTRHELYQARNAPGPAGLDISNPLSVISTGRDNPFNYFPLVKGGANWLFGGSRKATTEAADSAMQDPRIWTKIMEDYAQSKSPLSQKEYAARVLRQLLLTPSRQGGAIAGD